MVVMWQEALSYWLHHRPGGLAYVVAFANKGAKDVTQRYVASVLAADKLRDNAWWDETLKPLRKNEVGAVSQFERQGTCLWLKACSFCREGLIRASHNVAEAG